MRKIWFILSFAALFVSCDKTERNYKSQVSIFENKKADKSLENSSQERLSGEYCFEKVFNRDSTQIRLNINNENVIGEMRWIPFEKDGAIGILKGKLNLENEMDLIYYYKIEGVDQTETKIMKIENGKLLIKTGELIDPKYNGNLSYKDKSRAKYTDSLDTVICRN